jgi:Tfp pilus assembly protein PilP
MRSTNPPSRLRPRAATTTSDGGRWLWLSAALLLSGSLSGCLAGCGDGEDEDSPPPPPPSTPVESRNPSPSRVPQPGAPGADGALTTYLHVEDLMRTEAERATIRHQFRESDFVQDAEGDNRDPFRSYMFDSNLFDPVGTNQPPSDEMCSSKQMVATSYSYRDLRLVGIVSRGLKRYALMQDSANFGQIVTRGDCIGKEKARVKEIGAGYVTLEMKPDGLTPGATPVAQERSIQLYPDELAIGRSAEEDTVLPPVVMPPAPRTAPPPAGAAPPPAPAPEAPPPVVMPPPRTSPPAGSSAPAARPSGSPGAPIVPPS